MTKKDSSDASILKIPLPHSKKTDGTIQYYDGKFFKIFYLNHVDSPKKNATSFMTKLDKEQGAKILSLLEKILDAKGRHLGVMINETKVRYVNDDLFELKAGKVRLPFFYDVNDSHIVITSGFIKSTAKIQNREIKKAKRYKENYESEVE